MAYDGWIEFNGVEVVNVSRTAQLAEMLGIDSVWITPESVQWIADARGGTDWDTITSAPWYDSGYPASAEFAGIIPLSIPGLDDSTLESSGTEYINDGGNTGRPRNGTLSLVASVAIIASTERGAEYGKRWMDRVLRGSNDTTFCVGSDLRYFRYTPPGGEFTTAIPEGHRRDVKLTRGATITRKRLSPSSVTWFSTFTLTAGDSYEYGDAIHQFDMVSTGTPTVDGTGTLTRKNLIPNSGLADGLTGYGYNSKVVWNGTAINGGPAAGIGSAASGGMFPLYTASIPVAPGDILSASSLQSVTAGSDAVMYISFLDGAGNQVNASATVDNTTAGQRTVTLNNITVPDGVSKARIHVLIGPATGGSVWATDFLLEKAAAVGAYFDGDKPSEHVGSEYRSYRWDGSRATSSSSMYVSNDIIDVPGSGLLTLIQNGCPVYDYTPLYDPLYPALVPSPSVPDFLPAGWTIETGDTFSRNWVRVYPVEPTSLHMVPLITLKATAAERMVRVSVWAGDALTDDQCDPLWSAVITYIPPGVPFLIDGEQKACYVSSTVVRRTDSLVYGPDANPLEWTAFNHPDGLLVTVDRFNAVSPGNLTISLSLIPKSD